MTRAAVAALFLLVAAPLFAADANPPTLPLGAGAPPFELPGVDGKTHALKDFAAARLLLVVFTCNHCPTAQAYEERLKAIDADYREKGVAVVAISPNDPKSLRLNELGYTDLGDTLEDMKVRARDRAFGFPYLYDGEPGEASRAYGPVTTPHAFLFDAERKLRYVGRIDDSEREPLVKSRDLRNAIDALLAGQEVPVAKTRPFGCSVKWAGKQESVRQYLEKVAAEPVSIEPVDAEALKALRKNEGGKIRLVNVWATWCVPCVAEFPALVEIHRMYRHRAFETVTVSANFPDEKEKALAFLTKQQASCRNLIVGDTDKQKLLGAFDPDWGGSLPLTLLLAPDGKVLYRKEGPFDALELKRLIVQALKDAGSK
jgi:thiol-disulfide isomerase/thioredoxin